jgi:hypothetical protein
LLVHRGENEGNRSTIKVLPSAASTAEISVQKGALGTAMLRFSRKTLRRKKTAERPTPASDANETLCTSPKRAAPTSNIAIVVTPAPEKRKKKNEVEKASPATSASAGVKDSFQYPSKYFENRILQPTWLVQTPYGVGTVVACPEYVPGIISVSFATLIRSARAVGW